MRLNWTFIYTAFIWKWGTVDQYKYKGGLYLDIKGEQQKKPPAMFSLNIFAKN